MNQIIFKKTSNFWIDNGIVGLYKVLREIPDCELQFQVKLEADKLIVSIENPIVNDSIDIVDILNEAKAKAVKSYLKQTNSAGWIFKDGNFEMYRKTDFMMHLKPFFTGKTPNTEGALLIPDAKDNELGGKGRRMTSNEYQLFLSFKEVQSSVFINEKKVALTGKGFINTAPKYEIGDDFSMEFFNEGKKRCMFSGGLFQKADVITGMNYPFLSGNSGELNFTSHLETKPSISSLYSFISLFSFFNLNYLLQDDVKNYFMLYDGNLKELACFYNTISSDISQLTKTDYCSFETQIIGTIKESESFFNFLLSVYKQVKERIESDKRKGILLSKSVFTLSHDYIFRDVKEYTSISDLFDLFDCYNDNKDDERNYSDLFLNFIRYFNKRLDSGKYDTTWRNRLCSDILSFRSIHITIERFMAEVKMKEESGNFAYLDKIIEIYNNKTQKNMKTEMVEICKSVGNRIGAYCRDKDDKGILFSIRNAKNRTEFLNVLSGTQFRTEVSYGENFFKELPDNAQWEEYKALVSIFAMNSFLYKDIKAININK